ncbi:MAG TPA: dihydrolipoyllysine-residue acetyltransferase, partial [Burkholderiaceae bacterium]
RVPDIGDFKDVAVIELLVKPGDTVKAEQSLITVESDKASMEIPSSAAGVVKEMKVALGDKVNEGSLVLLLDGAAQGSASPTVAAAAPASSPTPAPAAAAPSPTAPPAAGAMAELRVPDIGDFKDVAVIEVFIKPGDAVKVEQSLITVESDKASMEIPASQAGVVKEVKVKLGDKVSQGSLVAVIEAAAGATAVAPPAAPAPQTAPPASTPPSPTAGARGVPTAALPPHEPTAPQSQLPHASPSVRRFARELGVPLNEVKGSGPKGRITHEDVQGFVKGVMSAASRPGGVLTPTPAGGGGLPGLLPWPQIDFTKFGAIERKDLSRIKKISGANLHRNWVMIPHVTNNDEADITELEALRVQLNKENEKSGIKVTMLGFVIKAVVAGLKKFPEFNTSLDGDQLVYKQYFNIGFAADTPNGLMVPVLKEADKKGLLQISQEMSELAKKARDGKLGPADMTGGCISISSLGGIGGTHFTPIINAPEVAILGLSKGYMKPVWDGKAFQPRLMLPLSLSYDHRVIDGAAAARFNAYLGSVLADFRRVLL